MPIYILTLSGVLPRIDIFRSSNLAIIDVVITCHVGSPCFADFPASEALLECDAFPPASADEGAVVLDKEGVS